MKMSGSERVLIFGKDINYMTSLCNTLTEFGYLAAGFTSPKDTLEALKEGTFDLFLAETKTHGNISDELVHAALQIDPNLVSMIITEKNNGHVSSEVVRAGAFDHIMKPCTLDLLMIKIARAIEVSRLRRSEETFRGIFEKAFEGIYLITSGERYIAANNSLARIFGYRSPDDLITDLNKIGQNLYVEPDQHEKLIRILKENDVVSGFEYQAYKKDGSKVWISENVRAVRDSNSKLLYYRGAVEDITKRKQAEDTLRESVTHFRLWAEQAERNKEVFTDMIDDLCDSYKKLDELFFNFVGAMVFAIDEKSPWTKGHSERVASYALIIAKEIGLQEDEIRNLKLAALLHDIGRIFVKDYLFEKSSITDEEYELIKQHPAQGATIIDRVEQLKDVVPLIKYHHERIDGKGYPEGLKGEEIPFCARILQVAESFDSMIVDRPYRVAPGKEFAISELKRCNNTQFDPRVTEIAIKVL